MMPCLWCITDVLQLIYSTQSVTPLTTDQICKDLIWPKRNSLHFCPFSLRNPRKEWTHGKNMLALWRNATYLFFFPPDITNCDKLLERHNGKSKPSSLPGNRLKHSTSAAWWAKSPPTLTQLQSLRPPQKRLSPGKRSSVWDNRDPKPETLTGSNKICMEFVYMNIIYCLI